MTCSCGRIVLGLKTTEHRNWNPECEEHGLDSEWFNSAEQRAKRKAQNDNLRDLQRQANEARRKARDE